MRAADLRLLRALGRLTTAAERDLRRLWTNLDAAEAQQAARDTLPALIAAYGEGAAALSAEWYDDLREEEEIRGRFNADPIPASDRGAQALIGWAASEATSNTALRTLIVGGAVRRISDHARQTNMAASVADPAAGGWMRTGSGDCGFCAMLISRGAVYSESSADFGAHDSCKCSAVPAFGGREKPVKDFKPSVRNITDADRARTRAWIREHNL